MSNIAIEFQNVGKMYRLGRVGTGTLSHDLNRWWQMTVLSKEDPYLKNGQTHRSARAPKETSGTRDQLDQRLHHGHDQT